MLILTSSSNFTTKHFVQHLPKKTQDLRMTFIPTAAEVEEGSLQWLKDDRQSLVDVGFPVTDFTLTGKTPGEVRKMLDNTDFVFVSGGNVFYLLQEMNKSGFSKMIDKYVKRGVIYGGSSAGSIVAGPSIELAADIDDATKAPSLHSYDALGLTDIIIFPHWGGNNFKERYTKLMKNAYKMGNKLVLLTDDQYLLVENDKYSIESI
ncbi:MAG: hypothetical protein COU65_03680 [Candidatus Pacebacteria bacterium CG10_big_fil_rev_8_21_14_0_10_42_12]|nr:MAG: hypothetical protein COU65_03680 [Candidatus Pacebacteria bacterium CG10_big_fil_rev_8_21_14_0_10_42_12]